MKALTVVPLLAGSAELSEVEEPPRATVRYWWSGMRRWTVSPMTSR